MKRTILSAMLLMVTFATAMAQDLDSKYATNLLKPGTVAPDFTLRTADEKDIKLRAFRGNYVVLDFWASWCSDCRKDIPAMKQLWSDFMDYNVRIIGISFDTSKEAWVNTYWDKYQMNWTQVSELRKWKKETKIDRLYHVDWIPTMYLIDPSGKIVLGTVEIEKLRATLEELKPQLKMSSADVMPAYVGGNEAMEQYLKEYQLYTLQTRKMRIGAKVEMSFSIEMDGTVTGARVLNVADLKVGSPKYDKLTDEKKAEVMAAATEHFRKEAVRLVEHMPKWIPALKNERPVKEKMTITVEFDPYYKGPKK
ncbi:redoxin domain-containing protein [Prevotella intermedia]|uniref:Cytochrome C biogenesis protein n=1 Tax=Prevotella intermedia TaxID=28131 RepID=A0A2G9IGL2_PREIN|nr:redoxin domain-containing protein [Prevotella intermedia]PIN28888.1 cytochrome C biogenesis protein [Prevotella intermedia]